MVDIKYKTYQIPFADMPVGTLFSFSENVDIDNLLETSESAVIDALLKTDEYTYFSFEINENYHIREEFVQDIMCIPYEHSELIVM